MINLRINEKFCKKYMRLAKQVAEDENPCLSRSVGCVIVNPVTNKVKATGYNGPPAKTPHPDDPEYLRDIVWPQITNEEKKYAFIKIGNMSGSENVNTWSCEEFVSYYGNRGICPRQIVGAKSSKRLELCSCEHGEKNAVINACEDLLGCWIFCWCGVPCWDCCKVIINSGINKVICLKEHGSDYSMGSRWLLRHAGVIIEIRDKETLDIVQTEGLKGAVK